MYNTTLRISSNNIVQHTVDFAYNEQPAINPLKGRGLNWSHFATKSKLHF